MLVRFAFFGTRRASSSTVFPYTTLFRSRTNPAIDRLHQLTARRGYRIRQMPGGEFVRRADIEQISRAPLGFAAPSRDRKSTRLNSSHANISYAVFCLKKKT